MKNDHAKTAFDYPKGSEIGQANFKASWMDAVHNSNLWLNLGRFCIMPNRKTRRPAEVISVQSKRQFVHLLLSFGIIQQHLVSNLTSRKQINKTKINEGISF